METLKKINYWTNTIKIYKQCKKSQTEVTETRKWSWKDGKSYTTKKAELEQNEWMHSKANVR